MSDQACHKMDSLPVTNKTTGEPESLLNKTLETGAAAVQVFKSSVLLAMVLIMVRTSSLCKGSARI